MGIYMNLQVIKTPIIVTVIFLFGIGIGEVHAKTSNEDARREQDKENERMRQCLKSVLETFAMENEKMEKIICDLFKNPPDINDLETRLIALGLSNEQAGRIISSLRYAVFYKEI